MEVRQYAQVEPVPDSAVVKGGIGVTSKNVENIISRYRWPKRSNFLVGFGAPDY